MSKSAPYRVKYLYKGRDLDAIQIWQEGALRLDTSCHETPERDRLEAVLRGAREYDNVDPYRGQSWSEAGIVAYYKENYT